jgi:protein gp37
VAETSSIEWTDATWNPVTGCSVVSPGCANCYAMKLAGTRLQHHPSRAGLTLCTKAGPVWTGEVRFNEGWLTQPLKWTRPRRIFVCAHGDLFHENVPDEWIDRVFAVMALAPHHSFQVLTKRAARMRDYMALPCRKRRIATAVLDVSHQLMSAAGTHKAGVDMDHFSACFKGDGPFPNIWLGVSAEDQKRADERIPDLLATPAAIRFVSAEPLLGPLDLHEYLLGFPGGYPAACACGHGHGFGRDRNYGGVTPSCHYQSCACPGFRKALGANGLHQVIVGGENGGRPMHPEWARQLRDQCARAGTPFFFKQRGSWSWREPDDGQDWAPQRRLSIAGFLLPRDTPPASDLEIDVARIGKKAAGRLLDGAEHNGMPA